MIHVRPAAAALGACLAAAIGVGAVLARPSSPAVSVTSMAGAPLGAGPVEPGVVPLVTNGYLRARLRTSGAQSAGLLIELRDGTAWRAVTSPEYGDWTFVNSSVSTEPTRVEVVRADGAEAIVRWTFGAHRTGPPHAPYSRPYPFEKTVWMRRGERGVFAHVRPLAPLPSEAYYGEQISEHEMGFGGIFGPGVVTTTRDAVRALPSGQTRELNFDRRVDVAELVRDGDPVRRIMVPIPPAHLLVPRFSEQNYGGVFIHHEEPLAYGAYLYADLFDRGLSSREVCRHAWETQPLAVDAADPAALDQCGHDRADGGPAGENSSPGLRSNTATASRR